MPSIAKNDRMTLQFFKLRSGPPGVCYMDNFPHSSVAKKLTFLRKKLNLKSLNKLRNTIKF